MDSIEEQLRTDDEAESLARLRPIHSEPRRLICERFDSRLKDEGRQRLVDVGARPASDHAPFVAMGIEYFGVDLAVGNGVVADESDRRWHG